MRRRGAVMRRDVDRGAERSRVEQQVRERVVRRIAREEQGHAAEGHAEHEADVLAAALGGRERHELDRADTETVACGERAAGHAGSRGPLPPQTAERHVLQAARLDGEAHVVAVEDREESRAVILVRVRQHDEIDPALPRQQAAAEKRQQPSRIRAAVDEHDRAAELQQERVALSDIEGADAGDRRGGPERRDACDERSEREAGGGAHGKP